MSPRGRTRLLAVAVGAAAAIVGAGVAELAAAPISTLAGPFAAIAGGLVDLAPPWAKELAISLFGTADKPAVLVGIALALVGLGALAGLLEFARPPVGALLSALAGVLGVVAVLTRPESALLWGLPSVLGSLVTVGALRLLIARLRAVPEPLARATPESATKVTPDVATDRGPSGPSRRSVLGWAGGLAAIGVLAAIGGRIADASLRAATVLRDAIRLPTPARRAAAIPPSAELGIEGLSPIITPATDFYRIDISFVPPRIDPASWSLKVHGMVDRPFTIGWDELIALPLEEHDATLMCVSNEVGGDLIGTARWLGYPIRELLARAGPQSDADMVLSSSPDGFTAGTPLDALTDPDRAALLAIGMNGEPLPYEHGFPARLVVAGLYGYVSATKWVTSLEVTRFDRATAYWIARGWGERGPVKVHSRIDVPRSGQLSAGATTIAGVAWHPHTGIATVDVRVDDGPWMSAELSTPINADCWVQWHVPWQAAPGRHELRVRATSADGEVQTETVQSTVPDGATGLHTVGVSVA